jgi:hypothetical protein
MSCDLEIRKTLRNQNELTNLLEEIQNKYYTNEEVQEVVKN